MTVPARRPEDDALDRLEAAVVYWLPDSQDDKYRGMVCREAQDVIATVREALERLERENNSLRMIERATDHARVNDNRYLIQRAEAAEAEVRRLTQLRDAGEAQADADVVAAYGAAQAEVRRLTEMVRGHHQSLAAIGGGPCICDICSASPTDGGGATRCANCGDPRDDEPTEHANGRPGWKCMTCRWWNWLPVGGGAK